MSEVDTTKSMMFVDTPEARRFRIQHARQSNAIEGQKEDPVVAAIIDRCVEGEISSEEARRQITSFYSTHAKEAAE